MNPHLKERTVKINKAADNLAFNAIDDETRIFKDREAAFLVKEVLDEIDASIGGVSKINRKSKEMTRAQVIAELRLAGEHFYNDRQSDARTVLIGVLEADLVEPEADDVDEDDDDQGKGDGSGKGEGLTTQHEKPLDRMNIAELSEVAKRFGVNLIGAEFKKDMIKAIEQSAAWKAHLSGSAGSGAREGSQGSES